MKKTKTANKLLCCIACAIILTSTTATAKINGIYMGTDINGVNILTDKLTPLSTYKFPLLISIDGTKPMQITAKDLDKMNISIRTLTGYSSIENADIIEENGLCYVKIDTDCANFINEKPVKLRINLKTKDENITVNPYTKVGYNSIEDNKINFLNNGEAIAVDSKSPIFRKSQLDRISEINNNENIIFTGENWTYENNIMGINSVNLYSTNEKIEKIVKEYPDAELEFLSFPAESKFDSKGKLTVNLDENKISFDDNSYVYRYIYDNLYPLKFEYNPELKQVSFNSDTLSTYVFSNKKLN